MANILQVTRPTPDIENRTLENRDPRNHINNQHIQNQVDPSRVVRADGQEKGGSNAAHDGNYSVIDYESNYGAFIQRLKDSGELPELLKQLLLEDSAGIIFGNQESVAGLVEQLFTSINVNSPEELLAFLQSQQAAQVKFSGSFFDGIRNILFQNASQGLKEAALAFLKGYNDYSSGEHLLLQMRSLTDDISRLMLKSYRGDFEALRDMINWRAPDGDTAANTEVLNGRLIPFLSRYISRTHDYGAVRDAVMFFVLHAVKYENGDKGRLAQLFDRLAGNREAERFFKNGLSDLDQVLEGIRSGQGKNAFAAGKGFAVVADEVGNLAAKSDEAAKATKELIGSSIAAVTEGSHVVDKVTDSLQQTAHFAGNVTTKMSVVVEAVEKQTTALVQVTEGINQISAVVQNNSATSEECAAASETLSSQASMLKHLMSSFKLEV